MLVRDVVSERRGIGIIGAAIVLACVASACVAFPAAQPVPLRATLGVGVSAGTTGELQGSELTETDGVTAMQLALVAHPLSTLRNRRFDLGVGYLLEGFARPSDGVLPFGNHGLRLQGMYFLTGAGEVPDKGTSRFALVASSDLMIDRFSGPTDIGSGLHVGMSFEKVQALIRTSGTGCDPAKDGSDDVFCHAHAWAGEISYGVELGASIRRLHGEFYGMMLASLTFRLPAGLGAYFISLVDEM